MAETCQVIDLFPEPVLNDFVAFFSGCVHDRANLRDDDVALASVTGGEALGPGFDGGTSCIDLIDASYHAAGDTTRDRAAGDTVAGAPCNARPATSAKTGSSQECATSYVPTCITDASTAAVLPTGVEEDSRTVAKPSARAPFGRRARSRLAGVVVKISNPTYLRRLYMSEKMLRLLKITSTSHETERQRVCYHRVVLHDISDCSWEVWAETRHPVKHAVLGKGWAHFCRHYNVRVYDSIQFVAERKRRAFGGVIRVIVHSQD